MVPSLISCAGCGSDVAIVKNIARDKLLKSSYLTGRRIKDCLLGYELKHAGKFRLAGKKFAKELKSRKSPAEAERALSLLRVKKHPRRKWSNDRMKQYLKTVCKWDDCITVVKGTRHKLCYKHRE
mgnify:CR=1 FL=1